MFFHIRKLLDNSFQDSISQVCEPFCVDRTLNKDGSCPLLCMSQCYEICYRPLFPEIPPPPPPPPVSDHHHQSKSFGLSIFLIISLALLAATFFVFFTYTVYKLFRQQRQRRQGQPPPVPPLQAEEEEARFDFLEGNRGPVIDHPIWYIRTVGLQPSAISAITICKYKRGDGLVEGTECSVCLNEFQEDETLRLLPKCNHAFHIPCIDTWLRSHTNCPMCRAGILMVNSSTLQSPSPWQSSNNNINNNSSDSVSGSDSVEEETTQVSVSGNNIRDYMENDELNEQQVIIPIGNGNGIQPVRRSVSLDSLSASILSSAITADAFGVNSGRSSSEDKQDLEMKKRVDDTDQSLSKSAGSSSTVMRSLSCSAKVFLSRYNRSTRTSVVPLQRSS